MKKTPATQLFPRRYYAGVRDFWADAAWLARHRWQLRAARRLLAPAFRERLMLAVTAVNQCRYCSFAHTYAALAMGLSHEEIQQLLEQRYAAASEEAVALAYAQHWAEHDARPEPAAWARLVEVYGEPRAAAIDAILHTIRAGNLMGNTTDYLLFRLSGGRLGLTAADRQLS